MENMAFMYFIQSIWKYLILAIKDWSIYDLNHLILLKLEFQKVNKKKYETKYRQNKRRNS